MTAELIRYFKCRKEGCWKYSPFDLRKAGETGYHVECQNCKQKWNTTLQGTNCCFIKVLFTTTEMGDLSNIQSFNKK